MNVLTEVLSPSFLLRDALHTSAVIGLAWADTTRHTGTGRILARSGDLPSAPFRIVVKQP